MAAMMFAKVKKIMDFTMPFSLSPDFSMHYAFTNQTIIIIYNNGLIH